MLVLCQKLHIMIHNTDIIFSVTGPLWGPWPIHCLPKVKVL